MHQMDTVRHPLFGGFKYMQVGPNLIILLPMILVNYFYKRMHDVALLKALHDWIFERSKISKYNCMYLTRYKVKSNNFVSRKLLHHFGTYRLGKVGSVISSDQKDAYATCDTNALISINLPLNNQSR